MSFVKHKTMKFVNNKNRYISTIPESFQPNMNDTYSRFRISVDILQVVKVVEDHRLIIKRTNITGKYEYIQLICTELKVDKCTMLRIVFGVFLN
jgi:hypothetical protein